jgi:diguanylate cyclase (GGDEF)-like protein
MGHVGEPAPGPTLLPWGLKLTQIEVGDVSAGSEEKGAVLATKNRGTEQGHEPTLASDPDQQKKRFRMSGLPQSPLKQLHANADRPQVTMTNPPRWRELACLGGAIVLGFLIILLVRPGGARVTTWLDDLGQLLAAATAAVACIRRSRQEPPGRVRTGWRWLGLSALSWALGAIWSWYELLRQISVPFPSGADIGFLAAVPASVAGVVLLTAADGKIGSTLGSVYHGGGTMLSHTIALIYPVGDVVVATVVLTALAVCHGPHRRQLALIGTGLISIAVADSAFAYLTQTNAYGDGSFLDTGWVAGYLMIALAAARTLPTPASRQRSGHLSLGQIVLPYWAVLGAAAVALTRAAQGHKFDRAAIILGFVTMSLAFARQLLTVLENAALNRRLEATVSELSAREEDFAHQALHDPLTGLANRVLFADRVKHALERQRRSGNRLAVMICDLDEFKAVNDSLGHAAGDEVLCEVARRLSEAVRGGDNLARLGGDEFAILLEDVEDHADVRAVADRVVASVKEPVQAAGRELRIGISVGITVGVPGRDDGPALLRDADVALYEAKAAGKNDYRLFENRMRLEVIGRVRMKEQLDGAIVQGGQLFLDYQPILNLTNDLADGVETLLRWRHPERGVLLPGAFMQLAEETGAMVPIAAITFSQACAQVSAWDQLGVRCPEVSVNLSARQLHDRGLPNDVRTALEEHGIAAERLVLEVPERVTLTGGRDAIERLRGLKELGVMIAIDDYGSGYVALEYLHRLPADVLKIARAFTAEVATSPVAAVLVEAMTRTAHTLGLPVVVEGVETAAQFEIVRSLGCDRAQGYFIARPGPADHALALLSPAPSRQPATTAP